MWYYILYFYRWLKVTLLNICRCLFSCSSYEAQRYVPGDLIVINYDGGKYFAEVVDVVNWGATRLRPFYQLKSVMLSEFCSHRHFLLDFPNRRATPWEMRKYVSFLSQLQFASGDWFYNKFTRNNVYQVLKVELSDLPCCCPSYTISSFLGNIQKTLNISSSDIKLPNKPQFEYNQGVYIEPFHDYGNIIGVHLICSDNLMYEISIDGIRKRYSEDELLKFQNHITMDKTTTETKVFEPLFKVGDKVKVVPPKDPKNYRFGYDSSMKELEGRIGVITSCYIYSDTKSDQDDNYVYKIDIDQFNLSWSSQSFVKVEPQSLFKVGDRVKILPPKNKFNYRYGYNDKMQALEGQTAVITSCHKYSGCRSFSDDGYVYKINIGSTGFDWSSQSFEKVEPKPLFKVGDTVKIIPPKYASTYRHGYVDTMKKLEGKVTTITDCKSGKLYDHRQYPDDGYVYKIDIDKDYLSWSSQSFEKVESQPLFKVGDMVKIIPPKNLQKYRCGYVDEMRKLEGQVAVITKCTYSSSSDLYPDDHYTYKIDIDDLHLTWSSQSFVKLEEFQQATLQLFQSDITSVQGDDITSTIQCSKLSIFDCLSAAKAEEEKEEKKERYKLNFKIK